MCPGGSKPIWPFWLPLAYCECEPAEQEMIFAIERELAEMGERGKCHFGTQKKSQRQF